jgi:hypothetical protein
VYEARPYVTEELEMDRKKKQLSGQLIFDDSVKRLCLGDMCYFVISKG